MKRKPFFILMIITIFFVTSAVVMLLWNNILPYVFTVKTISYWQAVGLLLLSKILFSGLSFSKRGFYHSYLRGKWEKMNEEEKQQFKNECERRREEWRKRWH